MATEHPHEHIPEEVYGILPDEGVVELTDTLTGYMQEIELGGLTDIMGQVLDDLLDQSGGMPADLKADDAFEHITQNQLAVTLAYHLGRLEGRSPQIVQKMMDEAIEKWGISEVEESAEITDKDLEAPKIMVYPRLRRINYQEVPEPNVELGWEMEEGDTPAK
ncbi:MAG: hypothetical protein O3A93_04355 [Chloroflexi bacterium]|nr:hypothetical protein [Chloroflexota bacterium]MDA1270478.1 hypothetical protein [Chloroflexota bacterium]PKB58374.1 MAG: hypothetical protein BZY83_07385 [SAR202 cluster bacterium Casp-Chloro-G2]